MRTTFARRNLKIIIIIIIAFTAYFICGLVMTIVLESGTFRKLVYDFNIENSLNSIPTIDAKHKVLVCVSVLL